MTRTFIALEMNKEVQRYLTEVIRQVARSFPAIRWVDPATIHLTLAFLGELDDEQVAHAIQISEQVAQQSTAFSYRLSRLSSFGASHQPRVLWMGIEEPSRNLHRLHQALNQELEKCGFALDTRPFSPHLTLARLKAPLPPSELQRLQELLQGPQTGLISSQSYPIHALHVVKSELRPQGPIYTLLKSCPFQR
ncbi:RNA 2',3'-cyclic phosphodiesterase [Tengunoibacter tsumagoiensis]|uniref:RNA 2',3'-cyclic phosphodiesterase n=1 Tax=Tengunoibacter tsumagoiensis TaxID=2014871 RepID=A0A402A2I8_9CHLR|nr:RNA 2',3'-cyclic phosphodiesterase [Tengunoibacter tsumagoiensis]GCE13211.1 RNA 2',3'-cyclic phosphodiesterase [Tengunoibacter tsumagoiensis]